MKNNRFLLSFAAVAAAFSFTACNKFLDTMPDNRAEVDTQEKVRNLLVSAYPFYSYLFCAELMSDNVENLGDNNPYTDRLYDQMYRWEDVTESNRDAPESLWEASYMSIAHANLALQGIEEMGGAEAGLGPELAEALLCRAYNHFILVNFFCKNYNQQTSSTDLGIPYMDRPEEELNPKYERGTVADVYAKIQEDLELALQYVSDNYYAKPKYHFNVAAAYAFAARFYLYSEQWDLAEKYATLCLGSQPASVLRDWSVMAAMTNDREVMSRHFVDASLSANLLLAPAYSIFGRWAPYPYGYAEKYDHSNYLATHETFWAANIWGNQAGFRNASPLFYYPPQSYSGNNFDKTATWYIGEFFEYTDPVAGIGYPHIVVPLLTTDECILNRAEARVMLGKNTEAAQDLTTWMQNRVRTKMELTPESIEAFYKPIQYASADTSTIKKHLHPAFSIGSEGSTQESMLQCVLGFKRMDSFHLGLRWFDIKRYGIEIWRRTLLPDGTPDKNRGNNGAEDVLTVDDPRRAVQLPKRVIDADMTPNPR